MQVKSENNSHFLGLDPGKMRCGVARASLDTSIAFPVGFVNTEPKGTLGARILELAGIGQPALLVCGLPIELSGKEGASASFAREIGQTLAAQLSCGIEYIDERFSTSIAIKNREALGKPKRGRQPHLDADAAALILQTYLDRKLLS